MAKAKFGNGTKHELNDGFIPLAVEDERPTKKAKLLDDNDGSDDDAGRVSLKVNEEYARRFEHNKKRAEKHRLEEKYGRKTFNGDASHSEDDSEEDVSEDDEGEFATEDVDAEIIATLEAIRSKDPRVYDKTVAFYQEIEGDNQNGEQGQKREESMTLKQYHTKNLLEGKLLGEDDEDTPPKTYAQEQEETRQMLIKELATATSAGEEENEDFLVAKSKLDKPREKHVKITEQDVENADKDPEAFLSNFMASRAWVPTVESHFKPLESDDEDEDARAEDFENAYNMYFEDATGTNEKLVTYARDTVAATSVRRDELSGRRKAREAAKAKREAEKLEREEELARLRKYKIEEMEEKVKKIRKTAGLTGRDFKIEDWADVLEADWSDGVWDDEMQRRFGDAYYNKEYDGTSESDEDNNGKKIRRKPRKPKWDDDIDIHDLIPDFDENDGGKPEFTLSGDEDVQMDDVKSDGKEGRTKAKTSKQRKQARAEEKSSARRDRRLIEKLVDSNLEYEKTLVSNSKAPTCFRYRETSPTSFGMTARDILLANDSQLNEFAGLKKLAAFRDPTKKKKDRKALSKKARLRQWRKDTFGDEEGPKGGFEVLLGSEVGNVDPPAKASLDNGIDIREIEGKRKKRSRKRKSATSAI
ncbi:Krr1-domain-containing protein [Lojkania enalia]|uniref:Krr1-domain-containing protein n=1 Tax=Lojkania enalia TaxID=147567 RepID=A0A9P4N9F9_9PLEO|nr:Krr1-domain-containing protein [Didymosphaeria enalia]